MLQSLLELAAVLAVCAAIVFATDIATIRFSIDPSPDRARLAKWLDILSLLARIGFYVSWYILTILLLLSILKRLDPQMATHPPRFAIVAAFFLSYLLGLFLRRALGVLATFVARNPKSDPTVDATNMANGSPNLGMNLPWFPAMQYYALILNRTYKVFIADTMLCGAAVRGLIASPPIVTEEMNEKENWVNTLRATLYERLDVTSPAFLKLGFANFQIRWKSIAKVEFDPRPKWGMGNVPHSGKIKIRMTGGRTIELILLGQQDGDFVKSQIDRATVKSM